MFGSKKKGSKKEFKVDTIKEEEIKEVVVSDKDVDTTKEEVKVAQEEVTFVRPALQKLYNKLKPESKYAKILAKRFSK